VLLLIVFKIQSVQRALQQVVPCTGNRGRGKAWQIVAIVANSSRDIVAYQ